MRWWRGAFLASRFRGRAFLVVAFGALGFTLALDVVNDLSEGVALAHVLLEVAGALLALACFAILLREYVHLLREQSRLSMNVLRLQEELAVFLQRSHEPSLKLRQEIAFQMEKWGLTEAEKDVAWHILRGLSFKEIAYARGTSDRTARSQGLVVYQKAGVHSARELTAFFLGGVLGTQSPVILPPVQ